MHRGLDLPLVGDHVARHDLGRSRWPARQPHPQPGRGPVRRRGVRHPRTAPAGAPAREARTGGAGQRLGLALAGAQPRAGAATPGRQARCRPARRPRPTSDPAHQGLAGAAGREQAPACADQATAPAPGTTTTRSTSVRTQRRPATLSAVEETRFMAVVTRSGVAEPAPGTRPVPSCPALLRPHDQSVPVGVDGIGGVAAGFDLHPVDTARRRDPEG